MVAVEVTDDKKKTLLDHLYSGDSGSTNKIKKAIRTRLVSRINSVEGKRVILERPLLFDLRAEWKPVLKTIDPTS